VYLLVAILTVIYLGTWVYFFERYYEELDMEQGGDLETYYRYFNNYYNAIWLELTTVSGVGLGAAYPKSAVGRGVASFGCIASFLSLSVVIKMVNAKLKLTPKELSAYHLLH
jgi:hypothetical protein